MSKMVLVSILMLLFTNSLTHAEGAGKTAILKGRLYNSTTKAPLYDVKVSVTSLNIVTTSDGEGNFSITEVPLGKQTLVFTGSAIAEYSMSVVVDKDIVELGDISITPSDKIAPSDNTEIPTIAIEDNNANQDDDGSSAQGSSGLFIAGQDPFLYTTSNTFGQYYFKPRGISNNELQVNGIIIDNLEKGYSNWSQLGGLNDVLHGRNITYGLKPSAYAYGDISGSTYIDATAADQRKGNTLTYTRYNRNYRNRAMFTHNSGLSKDGWAWSVSGSRRWAKEGYTPGTFYDAYSMYGAISKVIRRGQFNLTGIAAPTKRGRGLNATEESYKITNDNQYNAAWGYQGGEKRNSRVVDIFQPIVIANYTYRPSDRTRWNTAIGVESGKYKSSTIDFYNAYSPRPDYYRNLPSYYLTQVPPLTGIGNDVRAQLLAHPDQMQINWDRLYNDNYTNIETINNVDGIAGNSLTGKRSLYVLSNYVDKLTKFSFNSNIEHAQNENLTFTGGLRLVSQQNENYRQIADLLGGDYFLNTYQFLSNTNAGNQNYAQNDLNHPNEVIRKDGIYGYHYTQKNNQGDVWGQAVLVFNNVDLFAALNAGYTSFSRDGKMRNGLFPNNSYGKSSDHNFFTHKSKAGVTYKLDLNNALYVNADYTTEAPLMSNTYISINTRDFTINDPTTIKTRTIETGYMYKSRKMNMRITGYASDVKDHTILKRFFYDDLGTQTFVSYIMNKVSTRSTGIEFSSNYKFNSVWSITGVAAVGQYFYTNAPLVNVYLDNDPTVNTTAHKVYIKNYYVSAGPQSVYSLAVNSRPGRWNFTVNFNYMDRNYIDIYPDRRTSTAVALLAQNSQQWNDVITQQKMPAAFTTDLYISRAFSTGGISKMLHRNTSLFVSLGITNLLNKKDIKVSGYEQLRYDFTNRSPDKFQNYYDYAFGINYAANITFRF